MCADPLTNRHARIVVIGQAVTIVALLIASAVAAGTAHAATSKIGRTFPIAEPDAMAEIEARTAKPPPDMMSRYGSRSGWSAMKAASLAVTSNDRVRSIVPFYTLDTEIRLPDGTLLYPKGFTFNPLTYVSLPQRLIVVHPRDLGWAIRTAAATDFILLTANDQAGVDAIALSETTGRPLYILEERVKDRLGLTVAPVIVAQVGQKLELTEVRLDRGMRRAAR